MRRTCLHWACKRNHAPVVAYLLHSGANKEILTKKGERPVQLTSKREIRKMLGGKSIAYGIHALLKMIGGGCAKHLRSSVILHCQISC